MFETKDSSYQAAVGKLQGADFIFFADTAIAGASMDNFIRSYMTVTDQPIAGDSTLTNSLFSPGYGFHYYSGLATGFSLCSQKLPLPSLGMRLVVDFRNAAGDANMSLFASTGGGVTGVSLIRATGSALSTLLLSAAAYLELVCTTAGTWAIAESNASVTHQVAD